MERFFSALMGIVIVAGIFAMVFSALSVEKASAVNVDMQPVACYTVEAFVPSKDGSTMRALLFNRCDSSFRWTTAPTPPDAEV